MSIVLNNMQNPKLGDASFAMSTICCNDHDWVMILMILKIYLSLMMNMILIIVFAIILKVKEICPRGNNKVVIYIFPYIMINVYYSY